MGHGYSVLLTVFLPLLIVIWISCLVICLYKHIIARLEKNRTGQCPNVRVVVENNNIITTPQPQQQQQQQQSVIPTQYAPVTSHLASSLTMADFLKMKQETVNLNDSLGPKYYPKVPVSTIPEPPASHEMFPSPIAPLEPPWPHLPPIDKTSAEKPVTASSSSAGRSLNASFNTRVNFLSNQILNPHNHTQNNQPNDRRIIR